jgi:hypothetical protein
MAARPLENMFQTLLGGSRNANPRPTETLGHMGTAIYGGHVVSNEKDNTLSDQERYRTFSTVLANCSVAAAGVRYFLNLAAKAAWTFDPADHPDGQKYAELVEEMMIDDPVTSWARIVRRAAMYRFYGFSIQEWTARRRDDGLLTLMDVAPRSQATIERWDVLTDGTVQGVTQRNPQDQQETYLPRSKLLYLVDDSLSDSPEGLGLFRHIVGPARRLARYEQLEGFGFETDLRGVPVGRAPYAELRQMVKDGVITEADAKAAVAPLEKFVEKHVKNPELGLLIDSEVFATTDERTSPSSQKKFDLSLLDGSQTSLPDMAKAIERINREIARVLGVESIILGDGDAGSHALSKDKTNQFSLTVDSTLDELADGFREDLMRTLFRLNGWDEDAMPEMKPEAVQYRDIDQITGALRDMAQAGAMLEPDDPAINDVRALLGISPIDDLTRDEDAGLGHNGGPPLDPEEDEIPERPEEEENGE